MDSPDERIFSEQRIIRLAETMAIPAEELTSLISRGASHFYPTGSYLFHESTPRLWMGIVEEGDIEIVRGNHGSTTRLATLRRGSAFSEGVLLDDLPHSASAVAMTDVRVWLIPRAVFESLRAEKPEVFYRMVGPHRPAPERTPCSVERALRLRPLSELGNLAQGTRLVGRARTARYRLLRRTNPARYGKFSNFRNPASPLRAFRS